MHQNKQTVQVSQGSVHQSGGLVHELMKGITNRTDRDDDKMDNMQVHPLATGISIIVQWVVVCCGVLLYSVAGAWLYRLP